MKLFILPLCLLLSILFTSCDFDGYGKKVKISDHTEVFIKNDATEAEAKKLGIYIDSTWKDQTNDKSFQLSKDSGNYTVRMVVDESKFKNDTTLDVSFQAIQFLIEYQVFKGSNVILILTDNKFKDLKTIKSNSTLFKGQESTNTDSTNTRN